MVTKLTRKLHPEIGPALDCPKYDGCSPPICPLDPDKDRRDGPYSRDGRKEPTCRLPKEQRLELGASLPWLGLWPKELVAHKRWQNATPEERNERTNNLKGRENAR